MTDRDQTAPLAALLEAASAKPPNIPPLTVFARGPTSGSCRRRSAA